MYPVIRLVTEFIRFRRAHALSLTGTHVSRHMCLPWDIDLWMELNNGRTLTLYDLGRLPLAKRAGLIGAMKRNGWGLTMAGAIVRYRRRIRMFEVIEMRSRALCWDARFIYLEQSMWKADGEEDQRQHQVEIIRCRPHSPKAPTTYMTEKSQM